MRSLLYPSLGRGRDGEQKGQARTYLEKQMQNVSVNCSNASDRGKQAKF